MYKAKAYDKDAWRLFSGIVGVASLAVGLDQYFTAPRFSRMESHLKGLGAKLDGLNFGLEPKPDGLEPKLDGLGAKLDGLKFGLEAKLDGLKAKLDGLALLLTDVRRELQELKKK